MKNIVSPTDSNVMIIDEAFYMPELDRSRRIWVYTPPGYKTSNKWYPVVYMHDGQNLFEEATAFGEEWGVDETLNSMMAECIIVGIDSSEHRMKEYNFHDHEEHGAGEGKQYISFIVNTLKPHIDSTFRTMPQREHTHIAGSSLGGLISLYGAIHFAETFGGAGIFSPSLWLVSDKMHELKEMVAVNSHLPQRIYFYGGDKEGENMVEHIQTIATLLNEHEHVSVDIDIETEGEHSEWCWRNKFPDYYNWIWKKAE